MFLKQNQFATVTGFGVRVKDEREKDRNHLIEITLEVPLTHELADEILPAMARDLFQEIAGDWVPKPEMQAAEFNLAPEIQILAVRMHPETEPMFRVLGVSLRKTKAKKTDANTWVLVFTATWQLGADTEATTIIRALKSGVYVTFEVQEPNLLPDPGQAPDEGATATVDKGGNVQNINTGRKRGGKKKTKGPEAEAKDQAAHAAQVGDEEPPAAADDGDGPADTTTH